MTQSAETISNLLPSEGVTVRVTEDAGPVLHVNFEGHKGDISLFGGHILSWAPAGQTSVLWLSQGAVRDGKTPIRGGIPICWPWFGPHPDQPDWPSHGVARTAGWELTGAALEPECTVVRLALPGETDLARYWPYRSRPELTLRVGASLSLELVLTNVDDDVLHVSQAMHSYFNVGDISRVCVKGLEASRFIDKLAPSGSQDAAAENRPARIDREVDRIYREIQGPIEIDDADFDRTITIAHTGATSAVLWNPWIEKSARLPDMGPADAYRGMVCVETGNIAPDALELAPGQTHRLSTHISVRET